jgi:hypothetical protein
MRRPGHVVIDIAGNHVGMEWIIEVVEQITQFLAGEQIEQHQGVGLLARLISVGRVALRLENAVQSLNVSVLSSIPVPVELSQVLVSLELTEDAIAMEGDKQPAAHLIPTVHLLVVELQLPGQFGDAFSRQKLQYPASTA